MEIRGMEVVGAKLSKGEAAKKLKKLFSMKMHGGLSHTMNTGIGNIIQRKIDRKKFKTKPTKCLGTSKRKCPTKRCGRTLKIWLGDFGKKRELLCPRCGYTTRDLNPEPGSEVPDCL